jgi:hypothetical protein
VTTGKHRLRLAVAAALATVGIVAALVTRPGDRGRAFDAYLLFLGALGVVALSRATSRSFPGPTESRLDAAIRRPRQAQPRVRELERLEREVELATHSAYDTYYRLRPTLREIAGSLLTRNAVDLERPTGRAAELLGPDAWSIVRPDLERPSDHHAPGIELATIERAVEALDRLSR